MVAASPEEASEEEVAMPGDLLGILYSVALIAFFLGLSFLISRFGKKSLGSSCSEVARKVVHIGVSNWFFIYLYVFESDVWPIVGLAAFTVMNAAMNVSGSLKVIMGQESKKRNWGLVQYPISIILLIVLKMLDVGDMVAMGCAILGMGYGDGLACLIGRAVKSRKLTKGGKKTIAGSLTMFIVVFAIVVLMKTLIGNVDFVDSLPIASLAALCATVVEAFTPFGLDNMTVPVAIYLIVGLI